MKNEFEWTDLYETFANELLAYGSKSKRQELLARMTEANKTKKNEWIKSLLDAFNNRTKKGSMTDIDPFTAMGTLNYKHGKDENGDPNNINIERRKNTLLFWSKVLDAPNLEQKLKSSEPLHFRGIPTLLNHRKVMADPLKIKPGDIDILWDFFAEAIEWANTDGSNTTQFEEGFNKAIKIYGFGKPTLTGALFWLRPYTFLSLDDPCCNYIKSKLNLEHKKYGKYLELKKSGKYISGSAYIKFLNEVKTKISSDEHYPIRTFPLISRAAYRDHDINAKMEKIASKERKTKERYEKHHETHLNLIELDDTRTKKEKEEEKRELQKVYNSNKPYTEKLTIGKARVGQGEFRDKLLAYWRDRCAVTSFNNKKLLRASHIKSWKESNNEERLDRYNGLLLSPNLDAAFDKGFITFNDDGTIEISKHFANHELLGITNDMRIDASKLTDQHKHYLKYHHDKIFKKN